MSITVIIIIVTSIVSVLAFFGIVPADRFMFNAWSVSERREYWRFLTYGLLHGGWGHLIINMFVLYSFGLVVEGVFGVLYASKGALYYLLFYVIATIVSSIWDYFEHRNDYSYNALGASGAVNAVLFASIVFNPTSKLIVFPIPIPLPAWLFAILYLGYSVYMSKRGGDNIGHRAHISGALFGAAVALFMKYVAL